MKKLLVVLSLTLISFLFSNKTFAQSTLTLQGTYGATNQSYISKGIYGGGVQYRYFVKPNVAIGISGKYLMEELKRELSTKSIRGKATNIPINLLAEYYFKTEGIRPYAGIEAGLNILKIEGYNIQIDQTVLRPGVAPKVGIVLPMGKRLSFTVEAAYQVVIGSTNSILMDPLKPGNPKYEVKNSNQAVTVSGGITYIFGKKK
ncbi:outer membrane beta-barrel protein [Dyadobacter sp. CY356]|uniref:outer membrane beta-barrel protein n=1 Tax=Dyadobacter sp. CY356 TaxID=2906442 RepID=UPI001F1B4834|nr:outer membrane beta-barrel protein [Dyadobacter sp. CY356]MCF0055824.1 outer membrane beta-barrel protein [Dyadobacter sp. CY356]